MSVETPISRYILVCCNLSFRSLPFYINSAWLYLSGSKWAFILSLSIRECGRANASCVYSYCWFGLSEVWPHIPKTKRTLHHHSWPWTCVWYSQKLVRYLCLLRSWELAWWLPHLTKKHISDLAQYILNWNISDWPQFLLCYWAIFCLTHTSTDQGQCSAPQWVAVLGLPFDGSKYWPIAARKVKFGMERDHKYSYRFYKES